jgi:hypothetical protein
MHFCPVESKEHALMFRSVAAANDASAAHLRGKHVGNAPIISPDGLQVNACAAPCNVQPSLQSMMQRCPEVFPVQPLPRKAAGSTGKIHSNGLQTGSMPESSPVAMQVSDCIVVFGA